MNIIGDKTSNQRAEILSCPPPWRAWDKLTAAHSPAFLWRDREGKEIFLALGSARTFSTLTECRRALRDFPPDDLAPRAFCAIAFDPATPMVPPWEAFQPKLITLPKILIRWRDGQAAVLTFPDFDERAFSDLRDALQNPPPLDTPLVVDARRAFSEANWMKAVGTLHAEIAAGSVSKVVLARDSIRETSAPISTATVLEHLAASAKDCYLFAHGTTGNTFLGASPEQLVELRAKEFLSTESLAGTRRRGSTPEEDERLAAELLDSAKERAEQQHVTDFLCREVGKLCRQVHWEASPRVRKLETVQHLCSRIGGELPTDVSLDDILAALHPTPAVCGTPQKNAQELISKLESTPRGLYAGAIGWIEADNAEFAVAIRSALLRDRFAYLFAGAGIVEGSDANTEWKETAQKLRPMLGALRCEEP